MGLNDTTTLADDSPTIAAFSITQNSDTVLLNQQPQDIKKSSSLQASFTLFKVFVGSGIMALPAAMAEIGFGLGIISMILAGAFTYYGMSLFLQVAQDLNSSNNLSLQELTEKVLGKWGKVSVDISLIVMQAGVGIALLIFSTQFLNNVVCSFSVTSLCDNHFFLACMALVVVVPLSFINNLHYFYIPSLMSIFFIFANVIVQLVFNFDLITQLDSSTILSRMGEFNFSNLPLFFGVATYAFEGIGVIFSVRSSMKKPQNFSRVLQVQMGIVAFLYSFFPATSELAFGKDVPQIILFSLPKDNSFYLLLQVLYVVSALLGYPVQIFPVVKILENSLGIKKKDDEREETRKEKACRIGLRLGLVGVMLLIAMIAKSFNLFINLMGSGVFTYLGYLLPIAVYQIHFAGRVPRKNLVINIVAFVVGLVLGVLGIIVSLQDIIDYQGN